MTLQDEIDRCYSTALFTEIDGPAPEEGFGPAMWTRSLRARPHPGSRPEHPAHPIILKRLSSVRGPALRGRTPADGRFFIGKTLYFVCIPRENRSQFFAKELYTVYKWPVIVEVAVFLVYNVHYAYAICPEKHGLCSAQVQIYTHQSAGRPARGASRRPGEKNDHQ